MTSVTGQLKTSGGTLVDAFFIQNISKTIEMLNTSYYTNEYNWAIHITLTELPTTTVLCCRDKYHGFHIRMNLTCMNTNMPLKLTWFRKGLSTEATAMMES